MNYSLNIKQIRKDLGMNQTQFAKLIGVSQNTISAYEHSIKAPSLDVLVSIAEKTGLSLDDIVLIKRAQEDIKKDYGR